MPKLPIDSDATICVLLLILEVKMLPESSVISIGCRKYMGQKIPFHLVPVRVVARQILGNVQG